MKLFCKTRKLFQHNLSINRFSFNLHDLIFKCYHSNGQNNQQKSFNFNRIIITTGILTGVGAYSYFNSTKLYAKSEESEEIPISVGKIREDLPYITDTEVNKHKTNEDRIWVYYKDGVYDITEFVNNHPGGKDKIMMSAGSSIEPFWNIYAVHYKNEVFELLEEHRIGNLKKTQNTNAKKPNDPFLNDPQRSPLLKVLTEKPFNAEAPKELSVENLITPNDIHFKRNHLPVPIVDVKNFKLEIFDELKQTTTSFTLEDLKTKFSIYKIPITLQCSGNRRKEMHKHEPVQGLMWDINAISTAEWTGVKLKDVLAYCGVDFNDNRMMHVQFEGLDSDPTGATYAASIPKDKALNDFGDVLLAFEMNGRDIPEDHGYPLRVVVPGVVAARSVKWLKKIIISSEESKSHWQQNDYKILPPNVKSLQGANFTKVKAIQESPIQSAICQPVDGASIDKSNDKLHVKGYAFSGGGNSIYSVMVSIDDGLTWLPATLKSLEQPMYRTWAWTLWECEVTVPLDKTELKILCVATDSMENTQPETVKSTWNIRGLLNNSWHSINVKLD
jgi:sulfite oxidase